MARRLMYWQVYLHKTSLTAELLLSKILKRIRYCYQKGTPPQLSKPLGHFLAQSKFDMPFTDGQLEMFLQLDDADIIQGLKGWQKDEDRVLAKLSGMLINRKLLKIKVQNDPFLPKKLERKYARLSGNGFSQEAFDYFVFTGEISNQTFVPLDKEIFILNKKGN